MAMGCDRVRELHESCPGTPRKEGRFPINGVGKVAPNAREWPNDGVRNRRRTGKNNRRTRQK